MLKSTAASIAPSIVKLFNLSISTGTFPTDWKCARITPILKASVPSLPKNYRPISILPIISKPLERHLHSIVFKHLSDNSPISRYQWGFSLTAQLPLLYICTLTHDWLEELDDGNEICSVFFDLKKAFDSVPHSLLLNKLSTLIISPRTFSTGSRATCLRGLKLSPVVVSNLLTKGLCLVYPRALLWVLCCSQSTLIM